MTVAERTKLVEMRNIRVAFGGVHAVDDVTVDLYPGEVIGMVGGDEAGQQIGRASCRERVLDHV